MCRGGINEHREGGKIRGGGSVKGMKERRGGK
jgi:hypothetical protein